MNGKKLFSDNREVYGLKTIPFAIKNFRNSILAESCRLLGFPNILPTAVNLRVTYKCDSRCTVCNIWQNYVKEPEKEKEELTLDEFKTFVDENHFLDDIVLSGGEVFLRDDIVNMWLYLDERGYRTGTTTNAVNPENIKKKEKQLLRSLSGENAHSLQISIDGIEEEHDKIRGIKGNFKKAVKLLEWMMKKERENKFFTTSISHNITQENYMNFPEFIDYFIELGLKPNQIFFQVAQTSPLVYRNTETLNTLRDTNDAVNVIKAVQKKYPQYKRDYMVNGTIKYLQNPGEFVVPCYAAITFFSIDPYWSIYPCINIDEKIGNLRETRFKIKPLTNEKIIRKIRKKILEGKCQKCWNGCHGMRSVISNPYHLSRVCYQNLGRILGKPRM